MTDAERLDFLEQCAKQSRTGVTLEWTLEEGFRLMTFHKVDRGQAAIRDAIDAAAALRN